MKMSADNLYQVLPSHFSRICTVSPTSRAKPWVTEPRKLQITVEEDEEKVKMCEHIFVIIIHPVYSALGWILTKTEYFLWD